jgi:hypothetical protein
LIHLRRRRKPLRHRHFLDRGASGMARWPRHVDTSTRQRGPGPPPRAGRAGRVDRHYGPLRTRATTALRSASRSSTSLACCIRSSVPNSCLPPRPGRSLARYFSYGSTG